jgi:hypothetical protein
MLVRALGLRMARLCGTTFVDCKSRRHLGRAFVFSWRGKIHVIGLDAPVRVVWLPQKRLTYWKQEIGFTQHPPPDFPRERSRATERT